MPRESVDVKARRYLVEGRAVVLIASAKRIVAAVRGDGSMHEVEWNVDRGWRCSCPARTRCSHQIAIGLVVVVPSDGRDD